MGEFNGIETYVHQKLQSNEVSWFPIGRTKAMEVKSKSMENEFQEKMSTIVSQLKNVKTSLLKIEHEINVF